MMAEMFGPRRVRSVVPGAVRPSLTADDVRTIGVRAEEYAAWAQTNAFPHDDEERGYRARWQVA